MLQPVDFKVQFAGLSGAVYISKQFAAGSERREIKHKVEALSVARGYVIKYDWCDFALMPRVRLITGGVALLLVVRSIFTHMREYQRPDVEGYPESYEQALSYWLDWFKVVMQVPLPSINGRGVEITEATVRNVLRREYEIRASNT